MTIQYYITTVNDLWKTVMKIARKISSALTFLFLLLRAATVKHKRGDADRILIAQGGNIGDALMNASAIIDLAKYYINNGKSIFFTCTHMSWDILRLIPGMELLTYIGGPDARVSLKSSRRLFRQTGHRRYEKTIALMCREPKRQALAINFSPDTVIMNIQGKSIKDQIINRLLSHYATIIPDDFNTSRYGQISKLFNALGISNYTASIAYIPKQQSNIQKRKKYVVISADSSSLYRRWQQEKFVELIHCLLSRYDYDVILTGTNLSKEERERYSIEFEANERVENLIGVTTLIEWIELIRGSDFLIGVDSGSIHIAASVGTLAICLTGVWDGHRFMPYETERETPNTVEPVCVYRQDTDVDTLACFDCLSGFDNGCKNQTCVSLKKSGKPCLCLSQITVDDVIFSIEKIIRRKNL